MNNIKKTSCELIKRKVRTYFLQNPNQTLKQISEHFGIPKSTVQEYLTNKDDLNVLRSLNESNLYFLFNNITERKIHTENDGLTIKNSYDFTEKEKVYLKSYGFKINS